MIFSYASTRPEDVLSLLSKSYAAFQSSRSCTRSSSSEAEPRRLWRWLFLPISGRGHAEDSRDVFADDEGDEEVDSGGEGCEWRQILPTRRFTLLVAL